MEDLVTAQSFKFFTILGIDSKWLAISPEKWEDEEGFKVAKEFVNTVKVTNDVAERGVKLAADYATILTKDDGIRAKLHFSYYKKSFNTTYIFINIKVHSVHFHQSMGKSVIKIGQNLIC